MVTWETCRSFTLLLVVGDKKPWPVTQSWSQLELGVYQSRHRQGDPTQLPTLLGCKWIWLVVFHQPLWKICASQNGFIFPNFRGENKKHLSCHHLVWAVNKSIGYSWFTPSFQQKHSSNMPSRFMWYSQTAAFFANFWRFFFLLKSIPNSQVLVKPNSLAGILQFMHLEVY